MKCMKKEEEIDHTRGRNQGLDQKSNGEGEEVEGKEFWREKREFLSRGIRVK